MQTRSRFIELTGRLLKARDRVRSSSDSYSSDVEELDEMEPDADQSDAPDALAFDAERELSGRALDRRAELAGSSAANANASKQMQSQQQQQQRPKRLVAALGIGSLLAVLRPATSVNSAQRHANANGARAAERTEAGRRTLFSALQNRASAFIQQHSGRIRLAFVTRSNQSSPLTTSPNSSSQANILAATSVSNALPGLVDNGGGGGGGGSGTKTRSPAKTATGGGGGRRHAGSVKSKRGKMGPAVSCTDLELASGLGDLELEPDADWLCASAAPTHHSYSGSSSSGRPPARELEKESAAAGGAFAFDELPADSDAAREPQAATSRWSWNAWVPRLKPLPNAGTGMPAEKHSHTHAAPAANASSPAASHAEPAGARGTTQIVLTPIPCQPFGPEGPPVETVERINALLQAMLEANPQLPTLLADYILNGAPETTVFA